ncbi:MAG: Bax inhibitor-1/YccA family protein [Deltaproteobacteria bacterium]|nr:Bax inhibitor-1/YccA family protein [Deltaproteobacteria bacterium]
MSNFAETNYGTMPIAQAAESARAEFLRAVGIKTMGSLLITALAAVGMMAAILNGPAILTHRWVSLGIMLGGIYGAQFIGNSMTRSANPGTQTGGFVVGSALSGIAISYVLLQAAALSAGVFGNPYNLILQAGALVGMTLLGMVMYLMTGPKELSMLRAGLSVLFLPMLGLMAITWFFPVGGVMGLVFSAIFVLVSAGGLLYSLNNVMHQMSTNQATAAAFMISSGIVILFWNILVLLMRLTSRD